MKNCAATFYAIPRFITLLKICYLLIVVFNMTPKFTEVTLNSFVSIVNIFHTKSTRKFEIIDITHGSFCLLQASN